MYTIGIDLGTSAVKLLLVDTEGAVKNEVTREYPLFFPHPGWSEQKPEDWWTAVCGGIPELVRDINKEEILGIGLGGQMHGLVALDADDNVVRPAILWNDGRTFAEVDYLNNEIGRDKLSAYTGN
ncbi:MAG: FGGY family carbohydrate kinase, partial [Lachnospiraceae bacterium]|nr:FGGY family carbohydrate kinase [Lachnospiraceae bacterium]